MGHGTPSRFTTLRSHACQNPEVAKFHASKDRFTLAPSLARKRHSRDGAFDGTGKSAANDENEKDWRKPDRRNMKSTAIWYDPNQRN